LSAPCHCVMRALAYAVLLIISRCAAGDEERATGVALAAFEGSGSRAMMLLLQEVGFFIATGDRECVRRRGQLLEANEIRGGSEMCGWTMELQHHALHERSTCIDENAEYTVVDHKLYDMDNINQLMKDSHAICYSPQMYDHLFDEALAELKVGWELAHYRAKVCKAKGLLDSSRLMEGRVAYKSYFNLFNIPLLARLEPKVKVLQMVRDPRDFGPKDIKNSKSRKHFGHGVERVLGGYASGTVDSYLRFWAESNLAAQQCGQSLLGPSRFRSVRIESFVLGSAAERRRHIVDLLDFLEVPEHRRDVDRLIAIFDKPLEWGDPPGGHPAVQTHYGRNQNAWLAGNQKFATATAQHEASVVHALVSYGYEGYQLLAYQRGAAGQTPEAGTITRHPSNTAVRESAGFATKPIIFRKLLARAANTTSGAVTT